MLGSVGSVGHVRRHTRTVTPSTTVWARDRIGVRIRKAHMSFRPGGFR
ncbi:hypothetical protein I547_4443 [Mycobacterium kansasii 824]|uniref:Uncharacterized protein n=1 Tax=Mycobacterium kansasii TaxID=1768 RepID=A0A1V3WAX1_MYCKA|nr:hypothetical protein I547_4443 [Mycobacterium kansasii 824]KEP40456.1 hypothetical protein MKSMC1_44100 [Mycobacterium kansasii]OOK63908.1 hypothetical protein BZL29_8416 [Mycobacterium kansasii]